MKFELPQFKKITLILIAVIWFLQLGPVFAYQNTYQSNLQNQTSNSYLQETVFYNTQSHKFHKMSCIWTARCTKNCIPISRGEALQRGVPCKVCGG